MSKTPFVEALGRFCKREAGASALEYAILVGVVSVALIATFTTFNDEIKGALSQIGGNLVSTASNVGTSF